MIIDLVTPIISGTPAVLAAILSFTAVILTLRNGKKADVNHAKIEEIHVSINGRMGELLRLTSEAEHAKGKLEGAESAPVGKTGPQGDVGPQGKQGEPGKTSPASVTQRLETRTWTETK